MKPLQDKVAIITGAGKARGIGRAAAVALAEQGATVVVTDITPDAEAESGLQVTADLVQGMAMTVDVTKPEQVQACVEKTVGQYGRIDILFNNAGVGLPGVGPFLDITPERWQLTWDINVMGIVHFCQAVIPVMLKQGGGNIVNNSSMAGLGVPNEFSAYSASKFAVISLSKSIAVEFGKRGIRCNAVCPGGVFTDMGRENIAFNAQRDNVSQEEAEQGVIGALPLNRWAQPEDVATAVAFLVSDAAKYITGVALPVSGGMAPGL